MSTQTQHLLDQTRADARTAVAALAAAARSGAAAEAAAEAYAAALDAAEADLQSTRARRPRRLTGALAAGAVAAVMLTGCGGDPRPVTVDAPLCDARTLEECYDASAGHYVDAAGRHYGPGALVHRGYLGLSTYVVPTH